MSDIKRISNKDTIPLMDELIYYSKIICRDMEIKNQEEASQYETLESIKNSDLYIKCKESKATISSFTYTLDDLQGYGLNEKYMDQYINTPSIIPSNIQQKILSKKVSEYISNYEELNNYYRKLNGLPDIGNSGIYLNESQIDTNLYHIDISKKVHEMDKDEQDILLALGIPDILLVNDKSLEYLKHIGSNKIDIYKARKALEFQILFLPDGIPSEISKRFESEYEINRQYVIRRVYSTAYKYQSDHYNAFISIFIIICTLCDIYSKISDFFIKGDIFDLRTMELIFKSNGIAYFPDIPKKYQKAMIRNINRLIKYKATHQSIVDICSLFGFDDIDIFKYYILKDRVKDKDGNFIFNENEYDNYELKFLKVPIDEDADNYIHDKKSYVDYDEITSQDKYWDGDEDHEYIKKKIVDYEFNILRSQYLSIDSVYSMTELAFDSTYFYNIFFDDKLLEDQLTIKVPIINTITSFKISEILIYLFALGYSYMGISDNILYKPSEVLTITGFNFDADLTTISNYIIKKGYTLKDLGVDNFQIPKSEILTTNQLMYIFNENKKVYDHICKQLINADNKDIYDVYKYLYDALLITNVNMEYFKKSDGTQATGYTDFLKDKNMILYNSLQEIYDIKDKDERVSKIANNISDIIYILEDILNSENYKYLWTRIPVVSEDSIKQYLYEVINYFKSYKTTLLHINTIYKFDDKLDNAVGIIDRIRIIYQLNRRDMLEIIDKVYCNIDVFKKEDITIEDRVYINRYSTKANNFRSMIDMIEKIAFLVSTNKKTHIGITDYTQINTISTKKTSLDITDSVFINNEKIE